MKAKAGTVATEKAKKAMQLLNPKAGPPTDWQNNVALARMLLRKVKSKDLRMMIKAWLGTSGAAPAPDNGDLHNARRELRED